MIIRRAKLQDARRISYLIRKNTEKVEANGHTSQQIKAWSDQNKPKAIREKIKSNIVFCAEENNRLVGTISLDKNLLCGMYVSYSQRGQGIGYNLIDFLISYARKKNLQELILTATPNGRGFYLKNGFKPCGEIELEFNGVKFLETKMRLKL